jgi:hypothetical protein
MKTSTPKRLICVDIAYARHQGLVEQRPFNLLLSLPQPASGFVDVVLRVERIAGDVGNGGRNTAGIHFVDKQATECALVKELNTLPTRQCETYTQMTFVFARTFFNFELTAHPEMSDQRATVIKGHPHVLAATPRLQHRAAAELGGKVRCAQWMASDGSWMKDLDIVDALVVDVASQPAADRLDLRKFRHPA